MHLRDIDLPDDTDMLLSGMRNFISRMNYHDFLPATDSELINTIQRLLNLGIVRISVAEHNFELVGGIGMLYAPGVWNEHTLNGEELFFWTSPNAPSTTALRLLRGVREQAREYGCKHLIFKSLTSSPDKLDKIYRSMKMQPVEISYMGNV